MRFTACTGYPMPKDRDLLNDSHRLELEMRYIPYRLINGDWESRFSQCVKTIDTLFPAR